MNIVTQILLLLSVSGIAFAGDLTIVNYDSGDANADKKFCSNLVLVKQFANPSITRYHWCQQEEIVKALLENGANVCAAEKGSKKTVLHFLLQNFSAVVEKKESDAFLRLLASLLRAGAMVNAQDHKGNTPLHELAKNPAIFKSVATILRAQNVVDVFCNGQADLSIRNVKGKTVLHVLAKNPCIDRFDHAIDVYSKGHALAQEGENQQLPPYFFTQYDKAYKSFISLFKASLYKVDTHNKTPFDIAQAHNNAPLQLCLLDMTEKTIGNS